MSTQLPEIFISYQHADETFARQVREHLAARGLKTWMDQFDIAVGAYWTDEIDKGLAASDIVVGVLSPDSVESRNVKNEWDWAIQNGKRLVLLQVKPCVIPHRYVSINFIDATRDAEMAVRQLAAVLARQDAFVALPLAGAVVRTHAPAPPAVDVEPVVVAVPADVSDEPFVGRERELAQARTALDAALGGKRQLLLLAGEPGIGKTRLAQQLTREARGRGTRVFWGHCYEWEGAPPYWPWIELLRTYAESLEPAELRRQLGGGAPFVVQIVPELAAMLPDLPVLPPMNPEQARFRLFDAVARFVQQAAGQGPLALVLDDLHWADEPSLLMLEFVARELRDLPLLLIGTYRDVEVRRDHPLARSLATLARAAEPLRIGLRGLAQAEVAAYLRDVTGSEPPDALVSAVHEGTEGNPFFVSEVVRLLQGEGRLEDTAGDAGWDLSIPESVRDVVGRRLDRLSPGCNDLLKTGAVIGREFTLDLLARIHSRPEDELLDPLDEAVEARVAEQPGAFGRYRFSHALIQATLYDELSTSQRVRIHSQVGRALEDAQAANMVPIYGELARHFARSPVGGNLVKAVDYAVLAGEQALHQVAWESAVEHLAQAVELLETQPDADPIRLCELLLLLGDAQNRSTAGHGGVIKSGAGSSPLAEVTFSRAAVAARSAGSPVLLARAALGLVGLNPMSGQGGDAGKALLQEALEVLPVHDSIERAQLLTALGARLQGYRDMATFTVEQARHSIELLREALDSARRIGDPETLVGALYAPFPLLIWDPDEMARFLDEATVVAESAGLLTPLAYASVARIHVLVMQGELTAVGAELRRLEHVAEQIRMPFFRWFATYIHAAAALQTGALVDAERLIEQGFAIQSNSIVPRVQQFTLRREHDRHPEIIDVFRDGTYLHDRFPREWGVPMHRAVAEMEQGRPVEARSAFEQGFAHAMTMADICQALSPPGSLSLRAVGLLTEVCAWLDDKPRAEALYTIMLPYVGKPAIDGNAAEFDFVGAAVDYYLGLLATTNEHWADAERHFTDALSLHEAWGWRLYIPWTQYGWASMLARRNLGGDRYKALDLLDRALALAGEIGMTKLTRLATALRQQLLEAR